MSHSQHPSAVDGPADRSHVGLGLASIGIGLLAGYHAWQYGVGTAAEMGPGFFPLAVCVLLVGLGGLLIFRQGSDLPPPDAVADSVSASSEPGRAGGALLNLRVLGSVMGGIFVFALTIRPLGLFLSVVLLSAIVSLGHPGARFRPVLTFSVMLAVAATLIFVVGLRLNVSAMPNLF